MSRNVVWVVSDEKCGEGDEKVDENQGPIGTARVNMVCVPENL